MASLIIMQFTWFRSILLAVAIGLSVAFAFERSSSQIVYFRDSSTRTVWGLKRQRLWRSPSRLNTSDGLELGFRKASLLAAQVCDELNKATAANHIEEWRTIEISLVKARIPHLAFTQARWFYTVKLVGISHGFEGGGPYDFSIMILPDGSIILPEPRSDEEQLFLDRLGQTKLVTSS